jgi:hypothetical protein
MSLRKMLGLFAATAILGAPTSQPERNKLIPQPKSNNVLRRRKANKMARKQRKR